MSVNVSGGGINGQVEAIRLGISRALVEVSAENRAALKVDGLMTRDPRMVEKKKTWSTKAKKKFNSRNVNRYWKGLVSKRLSNWLCPLDRKIRNVNK